MILTAYDRHCVPQCVLMKSGLHDLKRFSQLIKTY